MQSNLRATLAKALRGWFLPRSIAAQVKWLGAFDVVKMEKGEAPMKLFSRVDKIASALASLGVPKLEATYAEN